MSKDPGMQEEAPQEAGGPAETGGPGRSAPDPESTRRLSTLDDPTRSRLYAYVVAQPTAVSRDAVSEATGVGRPLVAYHLDRLVEAGLLEASFERTHERGGPGAGRPAKHYARAPGETSVSVPPRDYRLAAEILADSVAEDPSAVARQRVERSAYRKGLEHGRTSEARTLTELLETGGFEPYVDGPALRLRNCPFRALTERHRDTICRMNLAFLRGVVDALGTPGPLAELDPRDNRCCVAFVREG